jgi:hypothetical protein
LELAGVKTSPIPTITIAYRLMSSATFLGHILCLV